MSDRLGLVSYLVQLENGELWQRHVDHLRVGQAVPTTEGYDLEVGDSSSPVDSESEPVAMSPVKVPATEQANNYSQTPSKHHYTCTRNSRYMLFRSTLVALLVAVVSF